MSPNRRRQILKEILANQLVSSQDEIADALSHAGVQVTQTTVSRDLAAIGAVRGADGYRLDDTPHSHAGQTSGSGAHDELSSMIYRHVVSVANAQSLVVVKTAPGHAQMMASAFDKYPPGGVVGTVAGDDTIFLATTSVKASNKVVGAILAALEGEKL
jgi:transcriptional regulator of arginine metabolism